MTPPVLMGYDGSPASAAAIDAAARLLPGAHATIAYVWAPLFADVGLRQRLSQRAKSVDELIALVEREGGAQADLVAANGTALARAAGWIAEPLTRRCNSGEAYELARLGEERGSSVLVVGSRGLSGMRAVLGSTSDVLVHVSTVPVLVVPYPLLSDERAAAASGPIVVGFDGSAGARAALTTATSLLPDRRIVVTAVSSVDADRLERDARDLAGGAAEVTVLDSGRDGEGSVANALVADAAERSAAAVVVGSRGRSAARKILLGSVAMAVLHRAHRPVLVVPTDRFERQSGLT